MSDIPFNIRYHFDEHERDVPDDPDQMGKGIAWLWDRARDPRLPPADRIRYAGLAGSCARTLRRLTLAERLLNYALKLSIQQKDVRAIAANTIRYAHVLQWRRDFARSSALFQEALALAKSSPAAADLVDFAYQHLGKNALDQEQWAEAAGFFEQALALRRDRGEAGLIASSERALAYARARLDPPKRRNKKKNGA
jgi:tetratricopeptide (TPR) repeat protein